MLRSQHYCFVDIFHHISTISLSWSTSLGCAKAQSGLSSEVDWGTGFYLSTGIRTSGNRETQVETAGSFGWVWEERSGSQQDKNSTQVCKRQSLFSWSWVILFSVVGKIHWNAFLGCAWAAAVVHVVVICRLRRGKWSWVQGKESACSLHLIPPQGFVLRIKAGLVLNTSWYFISVSIWRNGTIISKIQRCLWWDAKLELLFWRPHREMSSYKHCRDYLAPCVFPAAFLISFFECIWQ